jgi:HKD family nuclease
MSQNLGSRLQDFCKGAREEVLLVAPFIKVNTLATILQNLTDSVNITVITRWVASEVVAGVSDIEVYGLLQARPKAKLLLQPCLHAKLYRADQNCLVGSANLTNKALGWSPIPNVEILISVNGDDPDIKALESQLRRQSIEATQEIYEKTRLEVEELLARGEIVQVYSSESAAYWLPTCIRPDYLYRIYNKHDSSGFLDSIVKSAELDLASLAVMPGLTEKEFNKYVRVILEQSPVVQNIHNLSASQGVTPDNAATIIAEYCISDSSEMLEAYWMALKEWLMYFFPDQYRTKPSVEIFEKAKVIS